MAFDIACSTDGVDEWLFHNSLILNPDKTEATTFETSKTVERVKEVFVSCSRWCVSRALRQCRM